MKRIFIIVPLTLSLQACFFIIPTGAIDRAVRGAHCVPAGTKVGDTVTDRNTGDKYIVVRVEEKLSDEELKNEPNNGYNGCPNPKLPVRAKLEAKVPMGEGGKLQ